ncbi:hypothetical protein KZX46_14070 [Polymorphobacter sp. PAMC 29334]|uniref:cupin domain-containing protein n=1 Tax=Polymorphobacter sp. PAMC 29334 TaxID=2862331 RepID=UPI001C75E26C|nr:hypothetical protein [Polymorphobacter sp. PAMC 29334]QYE33945.1 hypothetical protein KZX46_14070 [Polymorphobacter sp. PAMC 29334]
MRPQIEALDVDAMEWQPLGPPGLHSRLLSRDPETGARTALQRLSVEGRYSPPKVAHFHTTYEEILGVSGCFSFDSRTWIRPGAYVFHPPRTVHGFKSAIREESTFLSRIGRDLDVNLVHEPEADDLYVAQGDAPPRAPVAYADAVASLGWRSGMLLGAAVATCHLSHDLDSGEGSALVCLPVGWAASQAFLDTYLELFVLQGAVGVGAVPGADRRDYFFYPPGGAIGALQTDRPTIVYVNFGAEVGV